MDDQSATGTETQYFHTGGYLATKGIKLNHKTGMGFGYLTKAMARYNGTTHAKGSGMIDIGGRIIHKKDINCYTAEVLDKSLAVLSKLQELFPAVCDNSITPFTMHQNNCVSITIRFKHYSQVGREYEMEFMLTKEGYFMKIYKKKKDFKIKVIPGQVREQINGIMEMATIEETDNLAKLIETIMENVDKDILYEPWMSEYVSGHDGNVPISGMQVPPEHPDSIKMKSQFNGICMKCKEFYKAGDEIEWKKGDGAWHVV